MRDMTRKYKRGDLVECNGNKEGRIIRYPYSDSKMVEVYLFSGSRFIGGVCVDETGLKSALQEKEKAKIC